ncbi:hypothetical protein AABB24_040259 [Solanum stoloniferum]|uniref:Uncharacterized protein n=1 Tax=Solanum stoloniferum TaxID=62892 RepID=A0ABD2QU47_9SOLN
MQYNNSPLPSIHQQRRQNQKRPRPLFIFFAIETQKKCDPNRCKPGCELSPAAHSNRVIFSLSFSFRTRISIWLHLLPCSSLLRNRTALILNPLRNCTRWYKDRAGNLSLKELLNFQWEFIQNPSRFALISSLKSPLFKALSSSRFKVGKSERKKPQERIENSIIDRKTEVDFRAIILI